MHRSALKIAQHLAPPALLAAALLCAGWLRLAEFEVERDGYAEKTVLLNEICSKSLTVLVDGSTRTDWIELYNPTESTVVLSGCTLSDRDGTAAPWRFPEGTVLPEGAYLILQADGTGEGLHPSFKLRGEGGTLRLTSPDGTLLDSLRYPALPYDATYGRRAWDGATAGLFAVATPGAANPADYWQHEEETAALGAVSFSQEGGFYGDTLHLTLTADDPDALILYTLDGSEPDTGSDFYTAPLTLTPRSEEENRYVSQPSTLDAGYWLKNYALRYAPEPVAKATTVTARLYKDGVLGQSVTAQTYWVGLPEGYTLPVVSVTGEADALFGRYGIYLPGSTYFTLRKFGISGNYGNYLSGTLVPVQVQVYGTDGAPLLADSGLVKVTGGISRTVEALKNLQLRLDTTSTDLLPDTEGLTSFTLRGSGASSVHFGLLKDAFWNNYLLQTADGGALGVRYNQPVILFLQDEYWGVYTVRQRIDDDYFAVHYGLNAGQYECPEADNAEDESTMRALADEIAALNAGSGSAYAWADAHFDLDSYCTWLLAEMYTQNLDGLYSGGNNTVLWRATAADAANPYADGRWRFVLNDLDATMFEADADPLAPLLAFDTTDPQPLNWYEVPVLLFQKLWGCEAFRVRLTAAAEAALSTTYAPEALTAAFDAWCDTLRPEQAQNIARARVVPNALTPLADALTNSAAQEQDLTLAEWEQNAAALRSYLVQRNAVLRTAFGLS